MTNASRSVRKMWGDPDSRIGRSQRCCRFGIPKGLRPKAQWLRGTSYLGKTSPNKSLSLKGGGTFLSPIPPCRSGARMPPLLCSSLGVRDRDWVNNGFLSPVFATRPTRDATACGVVLSTTSIPKVVARERSNRWALGRNPFRIQATSPGRALHGSPTSKTPTQVSCPSGSGSLVFSNRACSLYDSREWLQWQLRLSGD